MTLRDYLEQTEKSQGIDLEMWLDRLVRAKNGRMQWDADYTAAAAILSNKVAITEDKNSLDKFTDKFFHTNWLMKLCIWLESYIMSADVYADLISHAGSDDQYPDRLTLEMELNRLQSRFEMVREWCVGVVPKRIRFGYGVSYFGWDNLARDQYWRNGKPLFMAMDPRRVWVDEGAGGYNFKDRKYIFCKIETSVDEAKTLFPEFKDRITETPANTAEGDAPMRKDRFDYYLCQYTKKRIVRVVDVEVTLENTMQVHQVAVDQLQEFFDQFPDRQLPDNMQIVDEGNPDGEPGYDTEITCAYQFSFSTELNEVLSEIEYVGEHDNFQFWCNHSLDDDIYPRGAAYFLKDEQTLKSFLLTKGAINAIKDGHNIPVIHEGAISDERKFVEDHNSFGYVAKIDAEWAETHPGWKPIDYIENKFNPQVLAFMSDLLKSEMQEFTGGTDAMMGQAQYAGMSAAQTGMLQASGATYTKEDELSYRDYVKAVQQQALKHICDYITYPHTIDGVNNEGKGQTIMVRPSDWDHERYFVQPIIQNNPEMVKQLKENRAMQLRGMGAMGTVRMLEEIGYNDAERIATEALSEQGILQYVELIKKNPQIMEMIDKLMAGQQSGENNASNSGKETRRENKASNSGKETRGGKDAE